MKKILITVGIVLILSIIAAWGYLFVYGTPQNSDEVFAKFGLGGEEREPTVMPETTIVDVGGTTSSGAIQRLRQLTTRPVAGATFTGTGILYVEQGTGHIYHINFSSGGETLISGTTLPKTYKAVFSEGGAYVAITTLEDEVPKTVVGSVTTENGGGALEGSLLPPGSTEIEFGTATATVMYLLENVTGSVGYVYDIGKKTSTQVFAIPLRDVRVIWGNPVYIYTSPSTYQNGHIYMLKSGALSYVTRGAPGLLGFRYNNDLLVTEKLSNGNVVTYVNGNEDERLALYVVPEKCVVAESGLFCGVPREIPQGQSFPDNWYKGSITLSDSLWSIDVDGGTADPLSDFLEESGREIDVKKIGTNETGEYIYFINKNDNTLWMFDTTL